MGGQKGREDRRWKGKKEDRVTDGRAKRRIRSQMKGQKGRIGSQMRGKERNEDDRRAIRRVARLMDSQGPGTGEQVWGGLDDRTRDLIELLFAERMCQFDAELDKAAPERNRKEYEQFQGWKERMAARCPGIGEDLEEFMDWVVLCGGEESQDAYIFGMTDGIRLMKLIDSI